MRIGEALFEVYLDGLREGLPDSPAHAYAYSNESFPMRIPVSLHTEEDPLEEALALTVDFHQGSDEFTFACDVVGGEIPYNVRGPQSSFDRDSGSLAPWVLRSLADAFEFLEAQRPRIIEVLKGKVPPPTGG